MPASTAWTARTKLWADMQEAGLTVRVEERAHQVGHCQRCHTVVEPLLSVQWWVRAQPLAEPAIEAVRSGEIQIVPPRFEQGLLPLDGEHPRLVHQPPTVVGPSHPRVVRTGRPCLRRAQRKPSPGAGHRPLRCCRSSRARPRRAGHVVLQRPVALQHAGLARNRPKTWRASIPPPCWRPVTTSSSSGWRA